MPANRAERHRTANPCFMGSFCRFRSSQDPVEPESGAARGTRTPDPLITNEVLYQLSYCGTWTKKPDRQTHGH